MTGSVLKKVVDSADNSWGYCGTGQLGLAAAESCSCMHNEAVYVSSYCPHIDRLSLASSQTFE